MKEEQKTINDFDFNLICDYFNQLERQGPGSAEVTKLALSFASQLPADARIADIGCGTGGQTITLAENTTGHITAVDLFPGFIETLNRKIHKLGYEDRISTLIASMAGLPFEENSLDMIWAEGSIYHMGYENGLKNWLKFLKPGGYVVVSEVSWFTPVRPEEIENFWNVYPEIDQIANKVSQMQNSGYLPVSHFILPESCWMDFYAPMPQAMEAFLKKYGQDEDALLFIEDQKREIELYMKYKEYYGYVFFIGRKDQTSKGGRA